jgi:hypothetical protein
MAGVQRDNKEISGEKLESEGYEKNLRQIFDKNFKDRSAVDAKFLLYVEDCVDEKINSSKKIKANER